MGKVLLTEYNVTDRRIKDNTTIITLADAHGEIEKLERAIAALRELIEILYNRPRKVEIKAVLIAGDIFESVAYREYEQKIVELLQELSKLVKIIISHGNHDKVFDDAEPEETRERLLADNYALWSRLKDTDNIVMPELSNDTATVALTHLTDDIDISTISIPPSYYYYKEPIMGYEIYKQELKRLKLCAEKFNILLAHSPKNIIKGNTIDEFIKSIYNMIIAAHMHAGLIPYQFRNDNCRRGLLGPGRAIFPENSYGIVQDGETMAIINGGITKVARGSFGAPLNSVPGAKQVLDKIFPPEINLINLGPSRDTTINKVQEKTL